MNICRRFVTAWCAVRHAASKGIGFFIGLIVGRSHCVVASTRPPAQSAHFTRSPVEGRTDLFAVQAQGRRLPVYRNAIPGEQSADAPCRWTIIRWQPGRATPQRHIPQVGTPELLDAHDREACGCEDFDQPEVFGERRAPPVNQVLCVSRAIRVGRVWRPVDGGIESIITQVDWNSRVVAHA